LVLVFLAACSDNESPSTDPSGFRETYADAIAGVLGPDEEYEAMLEVARVSDQKVRECMSAAGFDYPSSINVVSDSLSPPSGSFSDRSWVETYGFGVSTTFENVSVTSGGDPVSSYLESLSSSERGALLEQLGDIGTGGCLDQGNEQALRELGIDDVQATYNELPDLSQVPEVIAAEQDWIACAQRAGVRSSGLLELIGTFSSRLQALPPDDEEALSALRAEEVASALAVFDCTKARNAIVTEVLAGLIVGS
jgi:hypothetical protein